MNFAFVLAAKLRLVFKNDFIFNTADEIFQYL